MLVILRIKAKYIAIIALSMLLMVLNSCAPPGPDEPLSKSEIQNLNAKIGFSLEASTNMMLIELSFVMPQRDKISLQLPKTFLRKTALYDRIAALQVLSNGEIKRYADKPGVIMLEHQRNERVHIVYQVKPYNPNKEAAAKDSFYATMIRPDYFQFIGSMALILPTVLFLYDQEIPIRLEWNMPANFKIYNSFGAKQNQQSISNASLLRDALFTGGSNIREKKILVRGNPVHITFQGSWDYISDNDFVDVVGKLIATQRRILQEDNFPYFLVSFLQLKDECRDVKGIVKFAGTAHINSFRAYYPKKCRFSAEFKQLISHELFHQINGKIFKILHSSLSSREGISGKWFTEGFTDYFGRVFAYLAGVLSIEEYFETLNSVLLSYFTSPVRSLKLDEVIQLMFKKVNYAEKIEQLPYQQGEILALILNKKINDLYVNKSLSNLIKDMLKEARINGGSKTFDELDVDRLIRPYLPEGILQEFKKIEYGIPLILPTLNGCANVVNHQYQLVPGGDCHRFLE